MSIQNVPLMRAMAAKMNYLNERQGVLAQNMANGDTPGYQAKDLTKVDFGAVLKNVTDSNRVTLEATQPGHIPDPSKIADAKNKKDKITYEVSPDGNGVVMEEQMVKANETMMDYSLMTSLLNKQTAMYRVALGRQQ